ncbi:MAG: hypothetical protein ABTQ32_17055 [Myxococcaceae bacterium]
MGAAPALTLSSEKALKAYAEALAAEGRLHAAAKLIDEYLATNDAGWGLWHLYAQLSRRMGRTALAVTAYRASARQLEAAGHLKHARAALKSALKLAPKDVSLREDVARLTPKRVVLECVTDPYCPIFDILDDEAR